MGKMSLHKLLLVFCVVVWCWWCWWWSEWRNHPNIFIFQLRFPPPDLTKSSNKFYRTNQPRERLGQHHLLYVFLSACWKTGQDPCKNKHGENFIAQVWLVFCVVVWCWWCWWWSEWWNHPNISIFSLHFSPPEFTKSSSKLYPTN